MAQLRPSLLFNDVFGSAGDVTAYHRGGKCFLHKRISPAPVGTEVSVSTTPVPFETFPTFLVKILGASAVDGVLVLRMKLETDDPGGRYRLLCKLFLTRPGAGRNPGKLRNYLAVGTAGDPVVTATIPDYVSVSGLDLPAYQVHGRFVLLDTKTGYRSQYLAVSDLIFLQ